MGLMQSLLNVLAEGHDLTPGHAAALLQSHLSAAQRALASLVRHGLAMTVCGVYTATPEGVSFITTGEQIKPGPHGPHAATRSVSNALRAKVWRAIRIKGKFGLDELGRSVLDGTETGKDPLNNIGRYVSALAAAGYLIEMKRRTPGIAPTSPGKKRWMLVRDTGPKAPVLRRNGEVYDHNEARVYARGADHDLA